MAHNSPSISEMGTHDDWTIFDADGNAICIEHRRVECRAADVLLIAAAPELLEALEGVLAFEDPDSIEDQQSDIRLREARAEAWERVKAAIAKATGERP